MDSQRSGAVSPPCALETDEVAGIAAEFAAAARRAVEAGFDGVELHAANGYLLHQFLATGASQRTDYYGGSPNNPYNGMSETDAGSVYPMLARELDRIGAVYLHVIDGGEPVNTLRAHFRGTIITNGVPGGAPTGRDEAEAALTNGADLVAFGRASSLTPTCRSSPSAGHSTRSTTPPRTAETSADTRATRPSPT